MLYSAVIQPRPESFIQAGTSSSMLAVQSTVVRPALINTLPGAGRVKRRLIERARSSWGDRPSWRIGIPWVITRASVVLGN